MQLVVPVMDIQPTTWQGFAGEEFEAVLLELIGVLQFLALVIASHDLFMEGIEQVFEAQYLDQIAGGFFFQEHREPPDADGRRHALIVVAYY